MTAIYVVLAMVAAFAAFGFMLRRLDKAQFEKEAIKKEVEDASAVQIVKDSINRPVAVSDAADRLRKGRKRQEVRMPRS